LMRRARRTSAIRDSGLAGLGGFTGLAY
jgi:hypothetical protein